MSENHDELVADVAAIAEYAAELGIDGLAVDLPAENPLRAVDRLPKITKQPEAPVEKYIPDSLPVRAETRIESAPVRTSRLGLLQSSKLSNLNPMAPKSSETSEPKRAKQPEGVQPASSESPVTAEMSQPLPSSSETLEDVRKDIGDCSRCELCSGRTQVVHSTGNLRAQLMFVGEAPGADEDLKGEPFVGRAGQLLTKIIEAIGLQREEVFIGNINRCRPPGNRQPTLAEAEACKPFLMREIAVVRPKVIVVLGNTACQNLLNTKVGISKLRGNFQDYFGVKVMPTFHPAYLLRDPHKKREVWDDMKKVRDYLNTL